MDTDAAAAAHRRVTASLGGEPEPARFVVHGWRIAHDLVHLDYEIVGLSRFTETLRFVGHDLDAALAGPRADVLRGALDVLAVAASTSYYKLTIPRRIVLPAATDATRDMLQALVTDGLAEFAVDNDLDLRSWADIEVERPVPPAAPVERGAGVLVPVGGGKDSAVTLWLANRAGLDARAFAVNPRASMERTAAAAGIELDRVERRLDERLFAFNDAGGLNGHIPITAIVASIACVSAILDDRGDVLLSNEGSADEPTRTVDGTAVNHQYSKSTAFESLHLAAMQAATGGAVRAWSVLRPLPELVVAGCFVALGVPLTAVNSCNRAYALRGTRREWCGRCPKCLFVQVMLAPFTTPGDFRAATGFDALADPDLVAALGDLTDPVRKPFECVGTVEEVRLAYDLLAEDPRWSDHVAVRAHGRTGVDAPARLRALIDAVDLTDYDARLRPPLSALLGRLPELAS
jgi:UDP-N-acetyl-alpha-D-muramoyl-L-alanyl-L-glutamate epimerase